MAEVWNSLQMQQFFQENVFENVFKTAAILSWTQWINRQKLPFFFSTSSSKLFGQLMAIDVLRSFQDIEEVTHIYLTLGELRHHLFRKYSAVPL